MNYIALLGWSPSSEGSEIVPPADLVKQFRLDRVNKSPAVFDVNEAELHQPALPEDESRLPRRSWRRN